ncbi:hypothetical protein E0W68_04130 [Flavobacterium salilacus subsp. salilacus]|uniref:hypothetical protein n=1 Tax=Flavobacterium TaxID=237 RepID=UPI0010751A15|nr:MULTISPECIES: hypothetical protein [Flavobacterium]KAF2519541.1 hypothetical protein E0W68_04130 [Flavobacterium salilacus subsp. salilacus]MBE1614561.1 hypothetical protein [Flavobacterium sp. SaA2.13]
MKKNILALLLSFVTIAFVSCDYHDPNEDKFGADTESGWVQFETQGTTYVVTGLTTEFRVPVMLHSAVNTSGLDVAYTVTDVSGSTEGIVDYSGEMNIPSGQLTGDIVFTLPDSALTSCIEFTVTLASTSRDNVQIGLDDGLRPTTHAVVIGKGRDSFIGTYSAIQDGDSEYQTVVVAGEEPNELVVSNVFGQDANSETHIFLDAVSSNANISFPNFSGNYLFTDSGAGDIFVSNDFATFFPNEDNTSSTFDSCDSKINLRFFLVAGEPAEAVTNVITLEMTKQ